MKRTAFSIWPIIIIGVASLIASSTAAAQAGALIGTIVDDDGNGVEGVDLRATPTSSLSSPPRSTETDDDGGFRMVGLAPGRYALSYTKDGFEPSQRDVQVRIGEMKSLGELTLVRRPDDWVDPAAQTYFNEGVAAHNAGDYAKALESFTTVLEMAPDIPEVHCNLGLAYEKLGQIDEAIPHFERALELRPEYYDALLPLADHYTAESDWENAAQYLAKATALRPDDASTQYNYGAVTMNAGDTETARAAFNKVLELDPTRSIAHYHLGMIAVGQAQNDEAVIHLEKYLEIDPEGSQADAAKSVLGMLQPPPP
jgi:tetratricopeptide (TPR) repeat protein